MTSLSNFLEKFIFGVILALIFLLPLFFLPITSGFFEFNKLALLTVFTLLGYLAWGVKMILEKTVRLGRTPLDLPLLLFGGALILATVLAQNRAEALIALAPFILLILLYFLIINNFPATNYQLLTTPVFLSASLLSLLTLVFFLLPSGRFPLQLSPPAGGFSFPFSIAGPAFSPTGSLLTQALFFLILLPLAIGFLIKFFRSGKILSSIFYLLSSIFLLLGLGLSTYQLLTPPAGGQKPIVLPQQAGLTIAAGSLGQSFKTTLLGQGPGSFLEAFTLFKPIGLNLTDLWNLRFTASSNFYFQLLTEMGILAFAAYLFLLYRTLKVGIWSPATKGIGLSLTFSFVLASLFPFSLVLLFVQVLLLAFLMLSLKETGSPQIFQLNLTLVTFKEGLLRAQKETEAQAGASAALPWLFFLPIVIVSALVFYFGGRVYLADYYFQKSLIAATQNRGMEIYNLQIRAYQLNPWRVEYRLAYSQTNLALANSLAQKPDLTDQEKATITQLVQQSLREARNATVLAPQKVAPWENLAQIYRSLINFAQGADQWTIASYQQAIALDPTNPLLRINLGGLLYAQKQFDQAINVFATAVNLKPDLANSHYNLGHAFEEKGDLSRAVEEYKIAQSLVRVDSEDHQKVSAEIAVLEKKLPPATTPPGGGELQVATPPAAVKPPQPGLKLSTESGELSTPSGR